MPSRRTTFTDMIRARRSRLVIIRAYEDVGIGALGAVRRDDTARQFQRPPRNPEETKRPPGDIWRSSPRIPKEPERRLAVRRRAA